MTHKTVTHFRIIKSLAMPAINGHFIVHLYNTVLYYTYGEMTRFGFYQIFGPKRWLSAKKIVNGSK